MNIFAYTAPGADYPEYVSVNRRETGVEITVRSPKKYGGTTTTILLPPDVWEQFQQAIVHSMAIDAMNEV